MDKVPLTWLFVLYVAGRLSPIVVGSPTIINGGGLSLLSNGYRRLPDFILCLGLGWWSSFGRFLLAERALVSSIHATGVPTSQFWFTAGDFVATSPFKVQGSRYAQFLRLSPRMEGLRLLIDGGLTEGHRLTVALSGHMKINEAKLGFYK